MCEENRDKYAINRLSYAETCQERLKNISRKAQSLRKQVNQYKMQQTDQTSLQ